MDGSFHGCGVDDITGRYDIDGGGPDGGDPDSCDCVCVANGALGVFRCVQNALCGSGCADGVMGEGVHGAVGSSRVDDTTGCCGMDGGILDGVRPNGGHPDAGGPDAVIGGGVADRALGGISSAKTLLCGSGCPDGSLPGYLDSFFCGGGVDGKVAA